MVNVLCARIGTTWHRMVVPRLRVHVKYIVRSKGCVWNVIGGFSWTKVHVTNKMNCVLLQIPLVPVSNATIILFSLMDIAIFTPIRVDQAT